MPRFSCLWIPHFEAWAVTRQTLLDKHTDEQNSVVPALVVVSRGRVVSACPIARSHSIQVGFTLAKVQSLLPEIQIIPLHLPTVQIAWEEVLHTLYGLTPCLESLRPGLLMADIKRPSLLVPLLREWQAHCGVADDRTTAELAAYTTAPGTLRTIRTGCSSTFLRRVPVTVFSEIGVADDVIQRVGWFGWRNVAHLGALSRRQLLGQFQQGDILHRYAQASDVRPVAGFRPPPRLHTRLTFDDPVQEFREIEPALPLLVQRLQERLQGRLAQTITVFIESNAGAKKLQQILRDPTQSAFTLSRVAAELLLRLWEPSQPVARLEIMLGGLAERPSQQGILFGRTRPPAIEAVRAVERRYPSAMQHFVVTDSQAYLPEHFARLEPLSSEAMAQSQKSPSKQSRTIHRSSKASSKRPSNRTSHHSNARTTALQQVIEKSAVERL